MGGWIILALLMANGPGRNARVVPKQRTISAAQPKAGSILYMRVTPDTVNFQATDPDGGAVAGDAATTVFWVYTTNVVAPWTLSVNASSASLTNCGNVPASAVKVACTAVQTFGGNGACRAAVSLSTSPQVVAGGSDASTIGAYQIQLSYTLSDTWKQIARTSPACTLTLTYTANVP